MARSNSRGTRATRLSKRQVFLTVVTFMGIALLLSVVIALAGDGSEPQRQVLESCANCLKLGFATMLGMLAGRAPD